MVRIHREKLIEDLFGSQTQHEQSLLEASLARLGDLGGGILIYLRSGFAGVPLDTLSGGDGSRAGEPATGTGLRSASVRRFFATSVCPSFASSLDAKSTSLVLKASG